MARPPLPLGEHGEISIAPKRGQWVARCHFRGLDGITRKVERWGKSRIAARLALQEELRAQLGERTEMLRSESRFLRRPTSGWARSAPAEPTPPRTRTTIACGSRSSLSSASSGCTNAMSPSSTPSSPASNRNDRARGLRMDVIMVDTR